MSQGKIQEGVFAINKPTNRSSAQVLRDLQYYFNPSELFAATLKAERLKIAKENPNQQHRRKAVKKGKEVKIGHGGTLDPLATGVLICGLGKATRSLTQFLECTKTYETIILFGAATDTYDRVGKVLKNAPYAHITREVVEEALVQFRGKYMQLPPLYSSLKMNGKPLYEYAREGKEIPREIPRRPVEVLELEMLEWMEGGTHEHQIPSEKAGRAEINVALKLWKQEGQFKHEGKGEEDEATVSSSTKDAEEEFNERKRKMSEDQDELVSERPTLKKGKEQATPVNDASMSGGLGPPVESFAEKKNAEEGKDSPPTIKGPPAAKLRMTVTSGFYVRSLCHDLGAAVNSAALMAELVRTRQGNFELGKNALEYEDLDKGEKVWGPLVEAMLDKWNAEARSAPIDAAKLPVTTEVENAASPASAIEAKEEKPISEAAD